jgi:hypothetical protein
VCWRWQWLPTLLHGWSAYGLSQQAPKLPVAAATCSRLPLLLLLPAAASRKCICKSHTTRPSSLPLTVARS